MDVEEDSAKSWPIHNLTSLPLQHRLAENQGQTWVPNSPPKIWIFMVKKIGMICVMLCIYIQLTVDMHCQNNRKRVR
jgi:hypothetical protein